MLFFCVNTCWLPGWKQEKKTFKTRQRSSEPEECPAHNTDNPVLTTDIHTKATLQYSNLKKKASKRFDRISHMDPSLSESFCRTLPTNELPAVYNTSTLSLLVNKACRSKTLEGVCVCACTWVCVNLHICPWIKSKLLFLSPYRSASLTLLAISFNFFPFHSLSSCHSHLLFLFFPPCGN